MKRLTVSTSTRAEMVDITAQIQSVVEGSGVQKGLCYVYVPHTTAGLTINENADPDVRRDILTHLEKTVPRRGDYRHIEGNSDAHIKACLMGFSQMLFVEEGRLVLGIWQGVYFCEFDGPRTREVFVEVQPISS